MAALKSGGTVALTDPDEQADGMFAGYHEIRLLQLPTEPRPGVLVRLVYATAKQFRSGRFRIPREGLFALDSSPDIDDH